MKKLSPLIRRHAQSLWYVLTVLLPIIIRTGRRPVIFSRFAGMGDIICTIPAALELKKRHVGATFIYNCHQASACLPKIGGIADLVTSFKSIGLIGHWYRCLLAGFYSFSSDDDELTADDVESHIAAFGRRLGVDSGEAHPRLEMSATVRRQVQDILAAHKSDTSSLIVIHLGPSSPVKQWPRDAWIKLVETLRQHGYTNIVQLGARAGSYASVDASETGSIPGALSFMEQLPLEQSLALISLARLFIGIDSGLLHAAISMQIPSVAVWGPTTPHFLFAKEESQRFVVSQVECQGCHHRMPRLHWDSSCPFEIKCMKDISVSDVAQVCLAALTSKNHI